MEIVEVRGRAKTLDGSFDIRFDMACRICYAPIPEAVESTFRSDYYFVSWRSNVRDMTGKLTEDFVADAMLLEEVTQQLFVHSRLVHHLVMALIMYESQFWEPF
jgi:hypothetical protein